MHLVHEPLHFLKLFCHTRRSSLLDTNSRKSWAFLLINISTAVEKRSKCSEKRIHYNNIMVVIHLKDDIGSDGGFLFETTVDTPNDALIEDLASIHNLRLQAIHLAESIKGCCSTVAKTKDENETFQEITGVEQPVVSDESLFTFLKDLEEYIDKSVQNKTALTESLIKDKLENVRCALRNTYPIWSIDGNDSMDKCFNEKGEKGSDNGHKFLDPKTCTLWAAGKEFSRGSLVSDRLGSKNEKTKIICKFSRSSGEPPSREPIVTEEERKSMIAHYFKRQEELKRLAEANEDDYLNSEWADPRGLKLNLHNLSNVKAPSGAW